ncbi:Peptidyl-prolyl cis-trans isomerase PpiD [Enhygromyxa salina]|uniref:Peptidyl-prolyl cis-trans isomerase PpiD n=1 Tax=Enhygromyxa salina TaxID=215803 RepID=A0A0C2CSN8_9BACT|nr:Peptidyl-prolyl cis-trans isomerase PpiD [Enhygromyxa salina]
MGSKDAGDNASADAGAKQPAEAKPDPGDKPGKPSKLSEIPAVVATVDGHEISREAFEQRYAPAAAMVLSRRDDGVVPDPFQAMQRRTIIESLAWSKQLELEALRSKVDLDPAALAKQEADERANVRDWPAWLERIGQTVEIRHQANVDYFRERALFAARGVVLEPTEAELTAAYEANREMFVAKMEMVRASHLLITYGPRVGEEKIQPVMPDQMEAASAEQRASWDQLALARAKALREAAMAPGVDFNELARAHSEGPGAFRGGDMGLFPRQQMVGEYADAAFSLAVGEISQPIKSDKGYYVIRCFGHYQPGPLPFEAVRADLVRQLEGEKYKQARASLQAELDERFVIVSATLDEARAFKN